MIRVLILSLCAGFLAACRSTVEPLEVLGPRAASLQVSLDEATELVQGAGRRIGYSLHQTRDDPLRVVLQTPPELGFFAMVGEQERFQEAIVWLRERDGRVEIRIDATLVHGPPGGPLQRKERVGQDLYDDFFAALSGEMELSSREDADAPSVEP